MRFQIAAVRVLIVSGGLLGAAACSSIPAYESVEPGQPAAEMKFLKSYGDAGFGGSALQGFSLSADETCRTVREAATFLWTTGNETALRIVPDAPILVWASTNYLTPGGGNLNSATCLSVARFTPQRDHAYDVSQPTTPRSPGCGVKIIDRAMGLPPPDVAYVKARPCVEDEKTAKG